MITSSRRERLCVQLGVGAVEFEAKGGALEGVGQRPGEGGGLIDQGHRRGDDGIESRPIGPRYHGTGHDRIRRRGARQDPDVHRHVIDR